MRKCTFANLLLVSITVFCACDNRAPTEQPPKAAAKQRIRVSTAEEFIAAIGPNRIIDLSPGEYILSDVKDRYMDFVRWDPAFDGKTVTVRNVQNLEIAGSPGKLVRLIVRPRYVFVLNFEDCTNVSLVNLVLGHAPDKGGCDSGVVGATRCSGLSLRECDLFGSGTEGLTLNKVKDFTFEDCVIRDCTYGIMTVESSSGLRFRNCRFVRNQQYWAVKIHDTKDVEFLDCFFQGNQAMEDLFHVVSCNRVKIRGGEIKDNQVKGTTNNREVVKFEDVEGI